uniref:Uncharacterized protein n=1 Tax=Arundo donax TaxID=35708 RepID=A0A0A9BP56_ARUDO
MGIKPRQILTPRGHNLSVLRVLPIQ